MLPLVLGTAYCGGEEGDLPMGGNGGAGGSGGVAGSGGVSGTGGAGGTGGTEPINITDANVSHYQVIGDSCEDVKEDIFDPEDGKGYLINGTRYGGKAEMDIGATCNYNPEPQETEDRKEYCCKAVVVNLNAYCNATVYLPQWDGDDKCWDEFMEGLKKHEQGHVDICMEYKDKINDALVNLESTKCSLESMATACNDALEDLGSKADAQMTNLLSEHRTAQADYDSDNNHGETQGAILNCDCD